MDSSDSTLKAKKDSVNVPQQLAVADALSVEWRASARLAKLVNATDLKSVGLLALLVQIQQRAPSSSVSSVLCTQGKSHHTTTASDIC